MLVYLLICFMVNGQPKGLTMTDDNESRKLEEAFLFLVNGLGIAVTVVALAIIARNGYLIMQAWGCV